MPRFFHFLVGCLAAIGLTAGVRAEDLPWRMDPQRSTLEVSVHSTFNIFLCRVTQFDAQIAMERSSRRIDHAVVTFDLADVKTGRAQRDEHLLEWAQSEPSEKIEFRLTELTPTDEGWLMARGSVRLHGVEKSVTFPVRSLVQGALHSIDGSTTLDYRDFGLPVIRKFYVLTVDPHLSIKFHLQGWIDGMEDEPDLREK